MSIVKLDDWFHINLPGSELYLEIPASQHDGFIVKLMRLVSATRDFSNLGIGIGDEPGDGEVIENYIRRKGNYIYICVREMSAGLDVKVHKDDVVHALQNIVDRTTTVAQD